MKKKKGWNSATLIGGGKSKNQKNDQRSKIQLKESEPTPKLKLWNTN